MEPAIAGQMVISLAGDLMVDSCLKTCGRHEIELEMDCVWVESHQAGGYSHLNTSDINNDTCTLSAEHSLVLISVATTKEGGILVIKQKQKYMHTLLNTLCVTSATQ